MDRITMVMMSLIEAIMNVFNALRIDGACVSTSVVVRIINCCIDMCKTDLRIYTCMMVINNYNDMLADRDFSSYSMVAYDCFEMYDKLVSIITFFGIPYCTTMFQSRMSYKFTEMVTKLYRIIQICDDNGIVFEKYLCEEEYELDAYIDYLKHIAEAKQQYMFKMYCIGCKPSEIAPDTTETK